MLDPDVVLGAVVDAVRSVQDLITEFGNNPDLIAAHYYYSGAENNLVMTIRGMPSPSILFAYKDYLGGNFSGAVMWKHRIDMYIRPRNAAGADGSGAASAPHLWWMAMNKPVLGTTQSLRYTSLLDSSLYPMDTPTLMYQPDGESMEDFFVSTLVFPEAGDA